MIEGATRMGTVLDKVKYLRRCAIKMPTELMRYKKNCKEFSPEVAKQLLVHALREKPYSSQYIATMDAYIQELLTPITQNFLEQYSEEACEPEKTRVWSCWWQGEDQMPPIVRACTKRVREVFGKAGVECILITEKNINQYLELPDYIYERFHKGQICFAHLADIIRWGLITKYGGIWLDACDFLCWDDPQRYLVHLTEKRFYTQKFSSMVPHEPCMGKWCNGYFMGRANNVVASYTYAGLLRYWKRQSAPVDYIFLDYIIRCGYFHLPHLTEAIDAVEANSEQFYSFRWKLNEEYVESEYRKIMKESDFYNLPYKMKYQEKTSDGIMTYYGYILEQYM